MKTKLAKFLFQKAIKSHRFLQGREDDFYAKYLEELKSDKFTINDIIAKKGNSPDFVYFIMNGVVQDTYTTRYFECGQMINQDVVLKKQKI